MKKFVPHTVHRTSSQPSRLLGLTMGALALATVSANAASATWNVSPTNGFWEAAGAENNWGTGAGTFPGSTVGTASPDVATFLSSTGTNILINASTSNALALNIASIIFGASGATPSSFTIGTLGGNALSLTNSGTILLSSGITGANITQTINAPIVLAGTAYTIRNDSSTVSNTIQVAGPVSGSSVVTNLTLRGGNSGTNTVSGLISNGGASSLAVNKFDSATWVLTNRANSYTGQTTVSGGILRAVDSFTYVSGNLTMTGGGAMGTAQVTINGGQLQLRVNGDNTSASQTLTYANSSIFANNSATSVIDLDRAGGSTASNKTLAFAAGSVARGGTLTVTSANGYRLQLNNMNISGNGDGSYTFNPTTGTVLLSGTFNNNTNTTTATAILGGASTGNEVSANMINGVGTARVLAVTKSGASTWTLSGSNSYTGTTAVTAGTLLVSGTHTGGGAYSLTGGTFGGSGSITATSLTASAGAKLAAGGDGILSSTFTLALAGGMDLSAASDNTGAYLFDLAGVSASDKITLTTGTLNVGTLDFADFTFNTVAGFGTGTYVLFDAASTISGSIGTASGTIGGLGATLSIDSVNNNVLLTVVPEPGTAALLGLALSGLAFARRTRKGAGN